MDVQNDLIFLFLNCKINKETVKTLLNIYKIPFKDFNSRVKSLLKEFRDSKSKSLNVNDLLDDKFKKEILQSKLESKTSILNSFILDRTLESEVKGRPLLTFRTAKRLLNAEELMHKAREYLKMVYEDVEVNEESINLISKSLEFYLKNLFDKVEGDLDVKKVEKALKKDKNSLNL